jgi:hypothetical protein
MSSDLSWDGISFPEHMLVEEPNLETMESSISFNRPTNASMFIGVTWPQNGTILGAFAARAKGTACSTSHAWQQLQLFATPGTQLRIDGVTVAMTKGNGVLQHNFPRGSPSLAVYLQWIEPGCYDIEVLFFEPRPCSSNHVEATKMDLQAKLALKEVKIAYSNTSTLACADEACSSTVETAMSPQSKSLKFWVRLERGTLTQQLSLLTKEGRLDSGKVAVRNSLPMDAVLCCVAYRGILRRQFRTPCSIIWKEET